MINLDVEMSAEKIMVTLVFEINDDGIHTEMALIDQDTIILFYVIVVESEIELHFFLFIA